MTRRLDRAAVTAVTVMPATQANRPLVADMDEPTAGPRFERQIKHVHALGPRVFAEMLDEIAVATGRPDIVAARLEAYAQLDPEAVRFVGGDKFPPMPLGLIR